MLSTGLPPIRQQEIVAPLQSRLRQPQSRQSWPIRPRPRLMLAVGLLPRRRGRSRARLFPPAQRGRARHSVRAVMVNQNALVNKRRRAEASKSSLLTLCVRVRHLACRANCSSSIPERSSTS
jgi:hypothetical protein